MITVRSVDQEARFGSIWAGSPAMLTRSTCGEAGFVVVLVVVDVFVVVVVVVEVEDDGVVVFVVEVVVVVELPQDGRITMLAITRRLKNTIRTFFSIAPPLSLFAHHWQILSVF